jgi:hypothetical protein
MAKYTPEQIDEILDKVVGLLDSYSEAEGRWEDEQNHKHWDETYGERLGAYSDKLKQLNGDDFDIVDSARKEYAESFSDLSEDDYVNALEDNIKKVLDRVWPEATEEQVEKVAEEVAEEAKEVSEESEGENKVEAHVEAEDKNGDGEISEEEVETHTLEEKPTEEAPAEEEVEKEDEEDPVEKQYREFEEEFKKLPKRN